MSYFSVIIPVYNVKQYLNQCVDSVLGQSYKDFEILLVDDGSTDGSAALCDSYAQGDQRVRTIHKNNGGASSARNVGVRAAKGEYLLFLDSDDYWINESFLGELRKKCESGSDVVIFSAALLYPDGTIKEDPIHYTDRLEYQRNDISALKSMIQNRQMVASACTKSIRRSFFEQHNLYFIENTRCEDVEWLFRLSFALPSYAFHAKHEYVYRKNRAGSVTNSIGKEHISEYFRIIQDACIDGEHASEAKRILYHYIAYQYIVLCAHVGNSEDAAFRKSMLRNVRELTWLFGYTLDPRVKKISKIYQLFGFHLTVRLLTIYLRHR